MRQAMLRAQHKRLVNSLPFGMILLGLAVSTVAVFSLLLQNDPTPGLRDVTLPQLRTDTDQRIERIQERLAVVPEDHNGYLRLGGAYLQKARDTGDLSYYARAEDALLQTLELDPDNANAMTSLGALSLARHEFRTAMDWANRSIAVSPKVAAPYGVLGDAEIELGLYEDAIESYQTMVDIEPGLDSYARASYARELMGDVDGAIEAMELAVSAGPPGSEATAWARVQIGDLYFNAGDIDEAAKYYEDALEEFNGYHIALAGLGKARAAQGRFDEAIRLYERAANFIPKPLTLAALGDVYARIGDRENAQKQYDTVEFIAKLQALNEVIYNRELALFYADHDLKLETALELAQAELEVRKDIYGYDALAWALYKNGRLREAAEAIDEAMKLGTQDPYIFFHAGMIHYGLGNREKALEYLEHALELNPDFSILYTDQAKSIVSDLKGGMRR